MVKKTVHQMVGKPEPECERASVNSKPMHEEFRKNGECMFCSVVREAYWRGVDDALDGKAGF